MSSQWESTVSETFFLLALNHKLFVDKCVACERYCQFNPEDGILLLRTALLCSRVKLPMSEGRETEERGQSVGQVQRGERDREMHDSTHQKLLCWDRALALFFSQKPTLPFCRCTCCSTLRETAAND